MKNLLYIVVISVLLISCKKDHKCGEKGIIKDYTGLDGCGWVIVLENGKKLEPVNLVGPGWDVDITDGQKVWISYKERSMASICMVGPIVEINCLKER